jgi:hypothetical protein
MNPAIKQDRGVFAIAEANGLRSGAISRGGVFQALAAAFLQQKARHPASGSSGGPRLWPICGGAYTVVAPYFLPPRRYKALRVVMFTLARTLCHDCAADS